VILRRVAIKTREIRGIATANGDRAATTETRGIYGNITAAGRRDSTIAGKIAISILIQLNLSDNISNRNNLYPPVTKMLLPQVLLIVLLLPRVLRIMLIRSRLMISNVSIPP